MLTNAGVIGSDVPWLDCLASNALTWVITVTEFSMGHNGHGINLYGVVLILMGN